MTARIVTARRKTGDATVYVMPAVVLLVVVFFAPLVWFFVKTLSEIGSPAEIVSYAAAMLTSKAVVTALTTTNWISLAVVATCTIVFMIGAIYAYDPSRGLARRGPAGGEG